MYKKAFGDGNVWLAAGMTCFALFFALQQWAGTSPTVEFIRGFLIGLALVAFGAATVLLVVQHGQLQRKPAGKPTPSRKARR